MTAVQFLHANEVVLVYLLLALKSDSHLPKKINFALFASMKALKNDEKCFLFHLKSSLHSQDI